VSIVRQYSALDVVVISAVSLVLGKQSSRLTVQESHHTILATRHQALFIPRLRQIGDGFAHLVACQFAHPNIVGPHTAVQGSGVDAILVCGHRGDAVAGLLHHLNGVQATRSNVPAHHGIVPAPGNGHGGVLVEADAPDATRVATQTANWSSWNK